MTTIDEDPEVVCLCGSTKFKTQYRAENERLTREGKIVLSVGLFGHADDVDLTAAEKARLDELHKRKIDMADRVHVIDVDGYVGNSTQAEMAYAADQGIPVTRYSEQIGVCPGCGASGDLEKSLAPGQLRCPTERPECRVETFHSHPTRDSYHNDG